MESIDLRKANTDFAVQSMQEIYVSNNGKSDHPHKHKYFTVLIVEEAQGIHRIDFKEYKFGKKEIHFVSPGNVHQVDLDTEPKGTVITFSKDFLIKNNIHEEFIFNLNLFRQIGTTPPIELNNKDFDLILSTVQRLKETISKINIHRDRALGALLQLFLIYCTNSSNVDNNQFNQEDKAVCLLRDFKQHVEHNFRVSHRVEDYAQKLNITSKHLSRTVRKLTGQTAKEMISDRIVLEAKRQLLFTLQSIGEIAGALGFEEAVHFSGFFKKRTGESPSQFRNNN